MSGQRFDSSLVSPPPRASSPWRTMTSSNYGWLTESAIAHKKAKSIEGVESGTLLDLKAALYTRQTEIAAGAPRARRTKRLGDEFLVGGKADSNRGIAERNARDNAETEMQRANSKAVLERKARIYNSLVAGGVAGVSENFMVDFEQKGWDARDQGPQSKAGLGGEDDSIQQHLNADFQDLADERERWEQRAMEGMDG